MAAPVARGASSLSVAVAPAESLAVFMVSVPEDGPPTVLPVALVVLSPLVVLIVSLAPVSVVASEWVKVEVEPDPKLELAVRVAPLVVPVLGAVTLVESVAENVLSVDRVRDDERGASPVVVLPWDAALSEVSVVALRLLLVLAVPVVSGPLEVARVSVVDAEEEAEVDEIVECEPDSAVVLLAEVVAV